MSAKPGEAAPGDAGTPPEWASGAVIADPTSGQDNFVEPPAGVKATGFVPYRVKPPRNWTNWLFRLGWQWQQYFDATNQRCATQTVAASDSHADSRRQADQVCDGVADQVQIQAAIDALPAGGGVVYLSEGTFAIAAAIASRSGVTIVGAGPGVTILQVSADADYDVFAAPGAGVDMHYRDLQIDGNNGVRTGANNGIDFTNIVRFSARNVRVRRMNLNVTGGRGFFASAGSDNGVLVNCRAESNDSNGYDLLATDVTLLGCAAESCGAAGFRFADVRIKAIGCIAAICTGDGFEVAAGGSCDFDACTSTGNTLNGFNLAATHCTLTGSRAAGNGTSGLNIAAAADNTHVVGGAFGGNTGRGILCAGDACKFSGVDIRMNGGDGIESSGIETLVEGCTIHDNTGGGIDFNAGSSSAIGNSIRRNGAGGIDSLQAECVIADNILDTNTGIGITLGAASDRTIVKGNVVNDSTGAAADGISLGVGGVDCVIADNECVNSGRDGIRSLGDRAKISGNICRDNTAVGIAATGASIVSDNIVSDNGQDGIVVAGNDGVCSGNRISGSGLFADNTYDNLLLSTADRWDIHHNVIRDGGAPNGPRYGININATSDNNSVSNNMVETGGTGTINNAGAGNSGFPNGTALIGGAGAANREF